MQVFYYLRSLDDALTHALGAGSLFDITDQSEYVKTIVGTLSANTWDVLLAFHHDQSCRANTSTWCIVVNCDSVFSNPAFCTLIQNVSQPV